MLQYVLIVTLSWYVGYICINKIQDETAKQKPKKRYSDYNTVLANSKNVVVERCVPVSENLHSYNENGGKVINDHNTIQKYEIDLSNGETFYSTIQFAVGRPIHE